ncbi:restriction endonuclease subunit S [Empedobacter sp. UBA5637]|uniref:restriction endonuclease subunit S n=1 Tax=Empedobacter sp. UBA5637 TaxID=1946442 RepID=UPI0025BF075C|nr:restriction endonuclease subunit S [Empedobacter sp. UBA5637]
MNYKKLGDIVKFVSNKNVDGIATILYGINIDKFFMPSVANTIGVDLKKYKVVVKNQFACNRMHVGRDKRLPISMSTFDYPFIVSPAYDVFEVIDATVLPEYLMLWFRRSELDRQCWFYTDADVRGGLSLDALKSIEIEIPSIEKQREIVAQYQAVENKIKVNEQICEKLEATAQTLYKQWFVDFEFPNEEGQPYKSSGGIMVYNQELEKEIPEGWEVKSLLDIANYKNGLAMQNYPYDTIENSLGVIKIRELGIGKIDENSDRCSNNISKDVLIENGDMIFSWSGTLKIDIWSGETAGLNQHLFKVTSIKFPKWFYYYSSKFHLNEFIRIADSNKTSLGHIKKEHLENAFVFVPNKFKLKEFNYFFCENLHLLENIKNQNQKLTQLQSLLLSRLATLEG